MTAAPVATVPGATAPGDVLAIFPIIGDDGVDECAVAVASLTMFHAERWRGERLLHRETFFLAREAVAKALDLAGWWWAEDDKVRP